MSKSGLDELYKPHLQTLMRRTETSLAASGFDALVIHAGAPPTLFLDDQDYPYKVNPQFKAWVPITDNPRCVLVFVPGTRLKVLFHQPNDYWHKPAALPTEPWTAEVDLIPMADPSKADAHWANLGRVAFIGPDVFGTGDATCVNPPELLQRLNYDRAVKTPYELECMRRASELGARGHLAALAAFRRGDSEYEAHMRYLEACDQREEEMPYNNIVAYNETLRGAALPALGARQACVPAFLSHRCRRAISRLCLRYHAHLRGLPRPLRRSDCSLGRRAASALCRDRRRPRLSRRASDRAPALGRCHA